MRITGGTHRSRALVAPRGAATRPTSDRVREALFSILSSERELSGARVLDLYAGTGALALESLSRGAAHATLVESAKDALAAIRTNIQALGFDQSTRVVATKVERAATLLAGESRDAPDSPHARFDLVFADPPYAEATTSAPLAIATFVRAGLFADGARVVVEHAGRDAAPEIEGLIKRGGTSSRRYGDSALAFYDLSLYSPVR